MANEFRVKNGLIIDEVSSGAGVLSIIDSNITSDDGSIEVTVADGQTVTLGQATAGANIVIAPHGTPGSEKITVTNNAGTADDAIKLTSTAGGLTLHAGNDSLIIDADGTDADALNIDSAGGIDIDAAAGVTLDATTMSFDGTDDSNITVTGSNKDLNIGVAGGSTQELNLTSAGTGTGVTVQASAGDLDLLAATAKDIKIQAGQINVISKDNAANAIKLLADQGTSETILISNVQGTGDESIVLDAEAGGITLRADASGKRVHFHTPIIDTTQQATNMMIIDGNTTAFKISDSGNNAFITVDTSNDDVQFGSGIDLIVHDGGIIGPASASTKGIHIHSTGGVSIGSSTFIAGGTGLEVNPVNGDSDYVEARLYVGVAEAAIADTLHDEDLGFLVIQNASYTGGAAGGSMGMVVTGGATSGAGYTWGWGTARDSTNTFVLGHFPGKCWDDVRGSNDSPFEITTASDAGELMMITATGTHTTQLGAYVGTTATAGDHIWQNGSLAAAHDLMRLDAPSGAGAAELKLYEGAASSNNYVGMKAQSMSANYTMILPAAKGTAGQVLDIASVSGTEITLAWDDAAGGGMDVSGTNNRMVRMHNTDDIQDTGITVDDSDNVSGMGTLGCGVITSTGTSTLAALTCTAGATFGGGYGSTGATISTAGALSVDGASQFSNTITVGVDGTGYDVKFFGDTAGAYALWDESDDDLKLVGGAGLVQSGSGANTLTGATAISGATTMTGTLTVGVDNTGLDVKFFGATSGSFLLWDESDDALELTDSTPIKIGDGGDMQMYHDGTNSYITNSEGALKIATETSGIAVTIGHGTSEVTIADNLTITGDLTVNGALTEISTTSITVEDALIELGMVDGAAPSGTTSIDLGMLVNYYATSAKKGAFYWDSSATCWALTEVATESGQVMTPAAGATEMRYYYDASNYYSIGVAANGATTLQTVDSDGAAGNLQITADGTAELAGTTITLDSAGDIELNADGDDINLKAGSTSFGSFTNNSGVLQIKSATDKELEIRAERDMSFIIDDDAGDTNSFFTFKTEDSAGADLTGVDGELAPVTTKYISGSTTLGRTEYGKVVQDGSAGSNNTLFTYDSSVFSACEVLIHTKQGEAVASDGLHQVNKMIVCAASMEGGGTDTVTFSNYSVIYSDGSTELASFTATISSDTVSVQFDATDDDVLTYAVTFLA